MGKRKHKSIQALVEESIDALEMIQPAMAEGDCRRLIQLIDQYIQTRDNLRPYYGRIASSKEYRNKINPKKITLNRFHSEVKRCWEELPKGFVKDLYTLYYYAASDLTVPNKSLTLHPSYRLLVQSNKPLLKILTEGSYLKSTMLVRSIILFYLIQLAKLNLLYNDIENRTDAATAFGEGSGTQQIAEQFIEAVNAEQNSKLKEIMIGDAVKDAARVDRAMDQEMQLRLSASLSKEAGKTHRRDLMNLMVGKLMRIDLSLQELGDWIDLLLQKCSGYFESKIEKRYVHLLDASDLDNLDGKLHLLHPKLRNIFWDDLQVPIRTKKGKVNLYIDISGSMDATALKSLDGCKISSLDFAKALAVEMSKKRLLDEVYLFNSEIFSYQYDPESLAKIIAIGGTEISKVVSHIKGKQKNAVVITDACDRCGLYSEQAYFIGVKGASFRGFSKEAMSKYADRRQAVIFDGRDIWDVGARGETIKAA
jgi:hypothetical protein